MNYAKSYFYFFFAFNSTLALCKLKYLLTVLPSAKDVLEGIFSD